MLFPTKFLQFWGSIGLLAGLKLANPGFKLGFQAFRISGNWRFEPISQEDTPRWVLMATRCYTNLFLAVFGLHMISLLGSNWPAQDFI